MEKFKWRDITDSLLLGDSQRKIFVKGLKNKIYVTTISSFFANSDNLYDYAWLPLGEKKYLFNNIHKAFFFNDHNELQRPIRYYNKKDILLFNTAHSYKQIVKNIIYN